MRAWTHTSTNLPLEKGMTLVEDASYPSNPLKPNEVLVKVKSVRVNPADYLFSEMGWPARSLVKPSPIAGMDFSGEVVSTGSDVTLVSPGDRVFDRVDTQKGQPGSMAEYTKAEVEGCVPIPPGIGWDQVGAGDLAFIDGGTGGVGTFAIQLAKAHGRRVVLGADEVIDYRTENLVSVLKGKGRVFDLVVDYAYQEETHSYKASDDFLTDQGIFVMVPGGVSGSLLKTLSKNTLCPSMFGGGRATFKAYFAKSHRVAFQQIAEWMAEGKVRTVIDSVLEFENMSTAIEQLKSGRSTGKIIVHV
ncbi:putative oxidoreductase [Dactylonectria estremocensis]|uniref:Oxidoreductase n=1 Tax=Dactylonectria estremocensis TaxID=1079267 RepID=A0A9P9ESR6_9HYPO|nr:putative oxidoreductase [Dactylonectria estremocensis]